MDIPTLVQLETEHKETLIKLEPRNWEIVLRFGLH